MNDKIEIRKIQFGSGQYKEELELRNNVLRLPLGLSLYDENLTKEADDVHLGAFAGDRLVGVLILTTVGGNEIKMRQVGVAEAWRGKDVGAKLVAFAEDVARSLGRKKMVLNARKSVIGFYEKLGYEKLGGEFVEVTIPHQKMKKDL
ncbi:MAG TPA: GNAT family N-acetyltransferase [Bacteroidota bacterium]|nr:GNAT family N-acetyltransferase [Bacteroidota bacterium]